jgi:hypothetical protein
MKIKWKKGVVRVALANGKVKDADAVICGPLAIFKPDGLPRRVMFVPSGFRVCSVFSAPGEKPALAVLKARVEWSLANQAAQWDALAAVPFNPGAADLKPYANVLKAIASNPPRVQNIA